MRSCHSFAGVCLLAALVVSSSAARSVTYTNTIAQMTDYITQGMAAGNIPGVSVVLVDDQTVVWATGFGWADREQGMPADADSVYHIGSCSKAVTAMAFMQLFDNGLDLETPLTNVLSDFSILNRFTNSEPVTLHSMLNHHSGLPGDTFNGMITLDANQDGTDWLKSALRNDYTFRPVNERYSYCNNGWFLLSDCLRAITGTNFSAAMDAMLFTPLGMNASSFLPDKPAIINCLAACYSIDGERMPYEYVNAMGSGSMYSSVNDLSRFIRMVLADGVFDGRQIVSSNALDIMTTPQWTNLPLNVMDIPQGLGWDSVSDYRLRYAGKFFWKNGATYMNSAMLIISRDCRLGAAVIQNSTASLCNEAAIELLRHAILEKFGTHWPTNTFEPEFSPVTVLPQPELDALAGLYVAEAGYTKVEAVPGSLTVTLNAHTDSPTILSNIQPRLNGWFSLSASQNDQFAFTNLAGHDMLVVHAFDGAFPFHRSLGERYVPAQLPLAWNNRLDRTFRMVDMHPDDYFWAIPVKRTMRLVMQDGALITDWGLTTSVMEPQSDSLAFQRGLNYRLGGALHAFSSNSVDYLWHAGYLFMDESAIPTLAVPTLTNSAVSSVNGTQWYWFNAETGNTYCATLPGAEQLYRLRVTDPSGANIYSSSTNSALRWACASNGLYALAVSAVNPFPFKLSLTRYQAPGDFDGDSRSDLAVHDHVSGKWYIRSATGTLLAWADVFGGNGMRTVPADFSGTGIADLAVYDEAHGLWYARAIGGALHFWGQTWGGAGMVPVCGDYDGDGCFDFAVYSQNAGTWFILNAKGTVLAWAVSFGGPGLEPVSGDFDGDSRSDLALYDQAAGLWYALTPDGAIIFYDEPWGGPGFAPVAGDFNGDGCSDLALYNNGAWYIRSADNEVLAWQQLWGGSGFTPVSGDFDGDACYDLVVYDKATGEWYVYSLTKGVLLWAEPFGGLGLAPTK